MNKNYIPYALLEGELVDVNHPKVNRGLNENCKCPDPNCNEPLIARKGNINIHHFSHQTHTHCNGLETAISSG